ncbi:MAG: tetratricopeptide repeat protein [Hyphomonadaceae bacterium]
MSKSLRCVVVATAAFALAAPAQALVIVVGSGPARACYEAARDSRTDAVSLRTCSTALNEGALARGERAATLVNRGVIHAARGSHGSALADFNAAGRVNPGLAEAYTNRGQALLQVRQFAQAIEALNAGIERGPNEPEKAYYNRAVAYEEMGDVRAAYNDYRRAAELAPSWDAPRTELARFQVRR